MKTPYFCLIFPKLRKVNLGIQVYSGTSYTSSKDRYSRLRYIIFLSYRNKIRQPFDWICSTSKWVARLVLEEKLTALADNFDPLLTIKCNLWIIYNQLLPICMFIYSLSLFNYVAQSSTASERRLELDLSSRQESCHSMVITYVIFMNSEQNVADSLTKVKLHLDIKTVLIKGNINWPVEQWVMF